MAVDAGRAGDGSCPDRAAARAHRAGAGVARARGTDGKTRTGVSRRTLDRWVVARREGGFEALVPDPRQCPPRTDAEVVDLAAG